MSKANLQKLNSFLNEHKIETDSNKKITHTCCGPPWGKFNISENDLPEFYKLYNSAFNDGSELHITEVRKNTSPLVIDLDFKQDLSNNNRYYTDDNIKKVISINNMRIQKFFNVPESKLKAFVFEKKEPNKKNDKIHDGVHIIYPYLCIQNNISHVIRNSIIKKISQKDYFENIPHTNSLEDVFDKGVIDKTNWCLYGSSKHKSNPYLLSKIYTHDMNTIDTKQYKNEDLIKLLSVRKFSSDDKLSLNDSINKEELDKRLTSLNNNNNSVSKNNNITKNKNYNDDNIETVIKLTSLLSSDRASNYYGWIRVGWCLHNIDNRLLDCWIEFSKTTNNKSKFKKGECEKLWATFQNKGLGIGSLYHWVKQDNMEGYLKYKKEKVDKMIKQSVNGTSYDVAVVLHEMYQDVYVCSSLKFKSWYEFKNHKWSVVEEGYTLHQKISTEVVNEYSKLGANMYIKVSETDGDDREALLKKIGMIHKVIDRLKSNKFKNEIMAECRYLFYKPDFTSNLDENRDLMCFNNGVYDLENNYFREGSPDDRISLCTNNDYYPYDKDNKYIKELNNYFEQVQPIKEMREYVLALLSSYLQGHTPDEKFHIWTGSGANSKSKLIELVQMSFGDYAGTLPISLLTQKRAASGAATPEMAMTKGRRFCVFQEPEETDKINVGLMKELTGGDKVMARRLYQEPIEFKPQAKLLLTCNKLPYIPSSDGGTWRRLRVCPFTSKFVDEPQAPNEFKKDEYLGLKFENWKIYLISILINKFKDYKENGLIEPKEVTKFTNKYQASSDVFLEYLNENIVITNKKKDYLRVNSLYLMFKDWYKNSYSDRKVPGRREFNDYINEKYSDIIKHNVIIGITQSSPNDDFINSLEREINS